MKRKSNRRPGKKYKVRSPAMPPPIPMERASIIRRPFRACAVIKAELNQVINQSLSLSGVFQGTPYWPVMFPYNEFKVHSVRIWSIVPSAVSTTPGLHTMLLADKDESEFPARAAQAARFTNLSDLSGTMMRRIYQPLHSHWTPTEPTDKDWIPVSASVQFAQFAYASSTPLTPPFEVHLIMDFILSFRGVKMTASPNGVDSYGLSQTSLYGGVHSRMLEPPTHDDDDSFSVITDTNRTASDLSRLDLASRKRDYMVVRRT